MDLEGNVSVSYCFWLGFDFYFEDDIFFFTWYQTGYYIIKSDFILFCGIFCRNCLVIASSLGQDSNPGGFSRLINVK